jgi:hypothetical protein
MASIVLGINLKKEMCENVGIWMPNKWKFGYYITSELPIFKINAKNSKFSVEEK